MQGFYRAFVFHDGLARRDGRALALGNFGKTGKTKASPEIRQFRPNWEGPPPPEIAKTGKGPWPLLGDYTVIEGANSYKQIGP